MWLPIFVIITFDFVRKMGKNTCVGINTGRKTVWNNCPPTEQNI